MSKSINNNKVKYIPENSDLHKDNPIIKKKYKYSAKPEIIIDNIGPKYITDTIPKKQK